MKTSLTSKGNPLRRAIMSFALIGACTAAFASPALADPWHDHEREAYHHWHPHRHAVIVPEAPAVYAPPVVYAPPPPVEPGINLVIPLHIH